MAIDIEWLPLPTQNGDKDKYYPHVTNNGTVDFQSLCESITKRGSYTKGTVRNVLSDIVDVIAETLREGKAIDLAELGTFRLSVGTDAQPDVPLHKRKVTVRGVSFQPDRMLMNAIGTPAFRCRKATAVSMTSGRLKRLLSEYFETHESITRSQFETLCRLKRTVAYIRLNELVESGFLKRVGCNRETRYEIQKD